MDSIDLFQTSFANCFRVIRVIREIRGFNTLTRPFHHLIFNILHFMNSIGLFQISFANCFSVIPGFKTK